MATGPLGSTIAVLLVAPPPEREGQGSKADDSFLSSHIRDYKHDDWTSAVTNISIDKEEEDEHDQTVPIPQGKSDWYLAPSKMFGLDYLCVLDCIESLFSERKNRRTTIILDSGATMHVTGKFGLLSAFARVENLVYRARNEKQHHIAGIGTIICDKFHIPNVRYIPELGSGSAIVSVQQLASSGYLVMFCGGWCYVKGHSDGSLVGKGRLHDDDGLYHLEYLHLPDVAVQSAAS